MDSFYEHPRMPPVPTSTGKMTAIPVVPEVSMIFQNNAQADSPTSDSIYLSYNTWKARNQNERNGKPNCYSNPSQYMQNSSRNCVTPPGLTKQVRFDSPVVLQKRQELPPRVNVSESTPSALPSNYDFPYQLPNNIKTKVLNTLPIKPDGFTKPFEQIYMANIPNRHLDLSIIDAPRTAVGQKENLENISPNVNLGSNQFHVVQHHHDKQTMENTKNYPSNSRDVLNQTSRFNHYSVSNKNKFHDYQYPEKLDSFKTQNTQHRKEMGCDLQKISEPDKSDPLEKNRIIDLYNYKRGSFEAPNAPYGHRQTLDNLKFPSNRYSAETAADTQMKYLHANNCMYDSFDSHSCDNNKHQCAWGNDKELQTNPRNNAAIQTENVLVPPNSSKNLDVTVGDKSSDEPTVKDLLKIIHQQNDQLLILQKQVAALLNNRDVPKQIEAPPSSNGNINVFGEKCRTSTQLETQPGLCNPLQKCLPRKGPLPQFSLDVMTSFEVSIRRPQNLNRVYKDVINHQPKITEVTESDSQSFENSQNTNANNVGNVLDGICSKAKVEDSTEVSLTLNEPVHVRETCPTPENTVRIDMEDYSSDSDDEIPSDDRWFYKNVKGQVNHILRKSGIWPNSGSSPNVSEISDDIVTQNIRKKVKEATIKHLKSIGVDVPTLDDTDDITQADPPYNMGCNPNKVSFAVKQLLMKYLPNEQLAKLVYMPTQNTTPQECQQAGLIKRRPEFSFATVQYMQKYNLLTDIPNGHKANQKPQLSTALRQDENFDRILDITAIRQQPKLL